MLFFNFQGTTEALSPSNTQGFAMNAYQREYHNRSSTGIFLKIKPIVVSIT